MKRGATIAQVTRSEGLNRDQVYTLCREAGLRVREARAEREARRAERKGQIAADVAGGISLQAVCDKYEISGDQVAAACRAVGSATPAAVKRAAKAKELQRIKEEIVKDLAAGASTETLASKHAVTPDFVRQACREQGVLTPAAMQRAAEAKELQRLKEQIVKDVTAGASTKELAAKYAVKPEFVGHACRDIGMPKPQEIARRQREKLYQDIAQKISEGALCREAAGAFDVEMAVVYAACREHNVRARKSLRPAVLWLRIAKTLMDTGLSYRAVAKRHRTAPEFVDKIANSAAEAGFDVTLAPASKAGWGKLRRRK